MHKAFRSVVVALLLTGTLIAGTSTSAAAVPPDRQTLIVDETFQDQFLSEACGVDVTVTETGRVTFLTFPDRPTGLQEVVSIHLDLVAVAGGNSVRFKNLGVDLIRVEPDGTLVVTAAGIAPFWFTGVVKINLITGEVIHEPQHTLNTKQACEELAG